MFLSNTQSILERTLRYFKQNCIFSKKSIATRSYRKKYIQYCRRYKKSNNNIFNHWTDSSEDESSDDSNSDDESNNSSYTDKSENSNNKFPIHTLKKEDTFQIVKSTTPIIINSQNNASNNELTGENLVIDEGKPNNK